jgi:acyl-CoA thioester hydrolase
MESERHAIFFLSHRIYPKTGSHFSVRCSSDTCQADRQKESAMAENGERALLAGGLSGVLMPSGHRIMARVYFADTDFSGVVYHARYLEFLERGRSDFLRLAGIHHTELADGKHGEKIVWVVRRMEIDFRAPARIDDILTVDTRAESISGARIFMVQQIRRDDDLLIDARVEAAIIGEIGRPKRFPKEWIERFLPKG